MPPKFTSTLSRCLRLPYVPGARPPEGIDCFGLVVALLSSLGHRPPDPYAGNPIDPAKALRDLHYLWRPIAFPSALGDIVAFPTQGAITHLGVFIEGDKFAHTGVRGPGILHLSHPTQCRIRKLYYRYTGP